MIQLINNIIIPGKGISKISLDTHVSDVYKLVKETENENIKVEAFYPQLYIYTFSNSLSVYINIITGLVVRIDLFNEYSGQTRQKIGIGSTIGDLRKIYNEIFFDESYILIGKKNIMIIKTNSENQINNLDSISKNQIERIIIEKKNWR